MAKRYEKSPYAQRYASKRVSRCFSHVQFQSLVIKPTAFKEKPVDKELAQIHGSCDQKRCWP